MTNGVVALVTARGGSKRLPRKNVLVIAGKPLIAWTIEAALAAPSVRRVIVSTDDVEIAEAARQHGAEVPFMRPAELAGDHAPHVQVVEHAVKWLETAGDSPEYLLLLQPTSPLRSAADIEGIIALARAKGANSAVGLRRADHPLLCRGLDDHGRLVPYVDQPNGYLRTQDLPPAFAINGALYLIRPRTLAEMHDMVSHETLGYVMPTERSLDVDDADDLRLAERFLLERSMNGVGDR